MKTGLCILPAYSCGFVLTAETANATQISVRSEDCHKLISNIPADDVAVVPGADGRGWQVALVDIGGGSTFRMVCRC
jgi:hypothetical protein